MKHSIAFVVLLMLAACGGESSPAPGGGATPGPSGPVSPGPAHTEVAAGGETTAAAPPACPTVEGVGAAAARPARPPVENLSVAWRAVVTGSPTYPRVEVVGDVVRASGECDQLLGVADGQE